MNTSSLAYKLISAFLLVIIVFSTALPRAVSADDSTPPEPARQTEAAPPEQEVSTPEPPSAEAPAEEPTDVATQAITEVPADTDEPGNTPPDEVAETPTEEVTETPLAETAVPTDEPVSTPTQDPGSPQDEDPQTPAAVLQSLPEDIDLTVVGESGEAVALVTSEAVEAITNPDPYFTAAGVKYQFTADDCDPGPDVLACPNPIQAAIVYMEANSLSPDDQTLYVESGTFNESVSLATAIPGFTRLVGAGSAQTSVNTLIFENMDDFFISGFNIFRYLILSGTGNLEINDIKANSSAEGYEGINAIHVENTGSGDITIKNVEASHNPIYAGLLIEGGNNVTIENVTTNDNNMIGTAVYEAGNVMVDRLTSNDNYISGVVLQYNGNVEVTESKIKNNQNIGLFIGNSPTSKTLVTDSEIYGNLIYGLYLLGLGDVGLARSTVNNNGLLNPGGYSNVIAGIEGDVTIHDSDFYYNANDGIYIVGVNGNVNITDSDFKYNGPSPIPGWGTAGLYMEAISGKVYLKNVRGYWNEIGLVMEGVQDPTIVCSSFVGNSDTGIIGYGDLGTITLDNVTVSGNGYDIDVITSDLQIVHLTNCHPKKPTAQQPAELPVKIVDVTGGEEIPVECKYAYTMLVLGTNNKAKFVGVCEKDAQLNPLSLDQLPAPLPDGYTFVDSISANLMQGSVVLELLPDGARITITFSVPEEYLGKNLVLLVWDQAAGKWVELPMQGTTAEFTMSNPAFKLLNKARMSGEGSMTTTINFSGIYVLAEKQ